MAHPRATKDMDVLIRANTSNAERVYRALAEFGALTPLEEVLEVGADRQRNARVDYEVRACRGFAWKA